MPPWNSPNNPEITYSDVRESKDTNSDSEANCSVEPTSKVGSPPMRSATQPDPTRLTTPSPSMGDSISVPRAGPWPRSAQ